MFHGILGMADALSFSTRPYFPLLVTHLRNEGSPRTSHPCPSFPTYKMESLDHVTSEVNPRSKTHVSRIYRVWVWTLCHHPQSQLQTVKPPTAEILSPRELFNQKILEQYTNVLKLYLNSKYINAHAFSFTDAGAGLFFKTRPGGEKAAMNYTDN